MAEVAAPGRVERLRALRNLPPLLGLAWRTDRRRCAVSLGCRAARALLPVAALWLGKLVIDGVVAASHGDAAAAHRVWWWVAGELAIAVVSEALGRAGAIADSALGDRVS